jgi:formylglycine-generating enzyme required for sulfatase activity
MITSHVHRFFRICFVIALLACFTGTAIGTADTLRLHKDNKTEQLSAPANQQETKGSEKELFDYFPVAALVAAFALGFGIYQYSRRNPDAAGKKVAEARAAERYEKGKKDAKGWSCEELYRERLKEELGKSTILGISDLQGDSSSVDLLQTFVPLDLDQAERLMDKPFEIMRVIRSVSENTFETPDSALAKAVEGKSRMLLIIGEPGAGKTTIIRHFAMNGNLLLQGFSKPPIISYLPLSAMKAGEEAKSLPQKLCEQFLPHLELKADWFDERLRRERSLVLLDGLDEIGSEAQRVKICRWISDAARTWPKAFFVMSTRDKGYAEEEQIALQIDKRSAYVKRFSEKQQQEFLEKWFTAVQPRTFAKSDRERVATQKTQAIINYLDRADHKGLKELAGIPLMLQLMAIFWKESGTLPRRREELYRIALNYLLWYRESEKQMEPLLPVDEARLVLAPVSLWIQERESREETVEKDDLHDQMQGVIDELPLPHRNKSAKDICENMVQRISVLDHAGSKYQFRHKTFREYLVSIQLLNTRENPDADNRLKRISGFVGDPWWDEPLLFFIAQANAGLFGKFIHAFFSVEKSASLDQQSLTFLKRLVAAAQMQTVTPFRELLEDSSMSPNRQNYLLDCLKTIGSRQAVEAAQDFVDRNPGADKELLRKAAEVVELQAASAEGAEKAPVVAQSLANVFQSTVEQGGQYILIKGGSYVYSVTKKEVKVPDMYFAKYPVTNRLYRRFIDYLQSKHQECEALFAASEFNNVLQEIAKNKTWDTGFAKYLKEGKNDLAGLLRSKRDDDRKFGGDDQPVVSITWYAARSYCLWLSLVESKGTRTDLYRLPMEPEWEWAAAGKEKREYPWGWAEPTSKLANYDGSNIGATTPVGSYPEGATPEGLYDMAGNVWEWQENRYGHKDYPDARAFRGGSWYFNSEYLRCSARSLDDPVNWLYDFGFRVVRPSPLLKP